MSKIENLIKLFRLIPTGDNAQQFRYGMGSNEIMVFHYTEIARHKFNQSNIASLISLGMIVSIAETYSQINGVKINLEYAEKFEKNELWLKISLDAGSETQTNFKTNLNYQSLLEQRMTYRGFFKKTQFDFARESIGKVILKEKLSKKMLKTIYRMETMIFDDHEALADIEKWFRYTDKTVIESKTGMSLRNLNVDIFNALLVKLSLHSKIANLILRPYFKIATYLKIHFLYTQACGFGLVYLAGHDDHSIINSGKEILKIWLRLTELGMAIQPMSSASMLPFSQKYRNDKFIKSYQKDIDDTYQILKDEFNLSEENLSGIWLFRFGVPSEKTFGKNQRTLRLDAKFLLQRE